jgi:hypothetical protein
VLHFISAEDDPESTARTFCSYLVPGSFLAISHITSDGTVLAVMATIREAYRTVSAPAVFRSREEIAAFFAGLDLVHAGLVEVSAWCASEGRPSALRFLGVGRKR